MSKTNLNQVTGDNLEMPPTLPGVDGDHGEALVEIDLAEARWSSQRNAGKAGARCPGQRELLDVLAVEIDSSGLDRSVHGGVDLGVAAMHSLQIKAFRNMNELAVHVQAHHQVLVIQDRQRGVIPPTLS